MFQHQFHNKNIMTKISFRLKSNLREKYNMYLYLFLIVKQLFVINKVQIQSHLKTQFKISEWLH